MSNCIIKGFIHPSVSDMKVKWCLDLLTSIVSELASCPPWNRPSKHRNTHMLHYGLFHQSCYILTQTQALTSSIMVLSRVCAMLSCIFNAQIFLQPQYIPHREHKHTNQGVKHSLTPKA